MPKFVLKCFFSIVFCFLYLGGAAQYFTNNRNGWKKQREEIIWGIGAANFLGDLGGRNAIGTDYSPIDLELVLTRPSAMVGYRYRLSKKLSLKTEVSFLRVWGNDKLTTEPFRSNRNLNFRSNIFEGSVNFEYAFFRERKGNKYHIKHTFKRRQKAYSTYFYLFAGVGGFWFNPKTKYNNSWVALKPFATEGHNYSRISLAIPMGIGYKVTLNQQWALGFEFSFRK
ncbi:MAG: hypothetical protein IAF38_07845, partial [Bacteroidia bacterium]|nr:hypothetical protein [Bacteroidia bacterium]